MFGDLKFPPLSCSDQWYFDREVGLAIGIGRNNGKALSHLWEFYGIHILFMSGFDVRVTDLNQPENSHENLCYVLSI